MREELIQRAISQLLVSIQTNVRVERINDPDFGFTSPFGTKRLSEYHPFGIPDYVSGITCEVLEVFNDCWSLGEINKIDCRINHFGTHHRIEWLRNAVINSL